MDDTGSWVMILVAIVIGLFGLILASRALDTGMYVGGLLFFGFAIVYCFSQLNSLLSAKKDDE